jgi:ribosomal-protein-alanine N-acetyltransferase
VTIRPAGPADLDDIAAIQAASPEASQWNPADYLSYTCLVTESLSAFIVTRSLAPGENEILNLAVAPAARRSGIARALLTHALQASPGTWHLEVRASNQAAIQLYQSAGFTPTGHRQGYYRDSPEPAIVMRFQS